MALPKVVAICGFKRSGKDTIANYLSSHYGFVHVKIAEPLKDAVKILFNLSDDQVEGGDKELIDSRWGVTPRQIMQFFGTEIMQYEINRLVPNMNRNFWIMSLLHKHRDSNGIVISDVRFHHEVDSIKRSFDQNAFIIKVTNNKVDTSSDQHISENEWLQINESVVIENNGTFEELQERVDACMKAYKQI
jgi:hypothetical protein